MRGVLWLLSAAIILLASEPLAFGDGSLTGSWLFYKMNYRGQELPPSNPNLELTYEFHEDGTDRLHWDRKGSPGFCERTGKYVFADGAITDEVIWVNPGNAADCAGDPDMRVGTKTVTPAEIVDGELRLRLSLGDDSLVYLWKRL